MWDSTPPVRSKRTHGRNHTYIDATNLPMLGSIALHKLNNWSRQKSFEDIFSRQSTKKDWVK